MYGMYTYNIRSDFRHCKVYNSAHLLITYIQFWPTLFSSLQKPKLAFDPNDTGVNYTAGEVTIAICGLRLPERLALDSLLQEPAQVRLRIGAVYSIYLRAIIVSDVGIRCVTVHA